MLATWSGAKKQSNREGYSTTAMFLGHWTREEPAIATINQSNYFQKLNTIPTTTLITLPRNNSSHGVENFSLNSVSLSDLGIMVLKSHLLLSK